MADGGQVVGGQYEQLHGQAGFRWIERRSGLGTSGCSD